MGYLKSTNIHQLFCGGGLDRNSDISIDENVYENVLCESGGHFIHGDTSLQLF